MEVTALSRQCTRMEKQRIGDENEDEDAVTSDDYFKADIQSKMRKASTSLSGFILWLDFSRTESTGNDFLLKRPPLLPQLDGVTIVDEDDDENLVVNPRAPVSKKLVIHARKIASVARKMLKDVDQRIVAVASPDLDSRPIHGNTACSISYYFDFDFSRMLCLEITNLFSRKLISNAEKIWFQQRITGDAVLNNCK